MDEQEYDPQIGEHADWYVTPDGGEYYIIPTIESGYENVGTDGPIMDWFNSVARTWGANPSREEAEALGLLYVPPVLRRWSPEDGYYHA
jgi:hypothetical protein